MMSDDITAGETERLTTIRELIVALDRRKGETFRELGGALVAAVLTRDSAQADRTIPRQVSPSDRTIPRLVGPPDGTIHRTSAESSADDVMTVRHIGAAS